MRVAYLETSAAMKLLIDEAESDPLVAALTDSSRRLAASWLLHTELHCAVGRHSAIVSVEEITAVIDAVSLVDVTRGVCSPPALTLRCVRTTQYTLRPN